MFPVKVLAEQKIYDFFDNTFKSYEEMFDVSLNDVLKDTGFMAGTERMDKGGSFEDMISGVFENMYKPLITAMFPDSDMITEEFQKGFKSVANPAYSGTRSDWDNKIPAEILVPDIAERQISELAETFNETFFKALMPEGGTEWDALRRFGIIVKENDNFLEDFNRQMEEFGENTVSAFQNIEQITTIMAEMDAVMLSLSTVSDDTVSVLNSMIITWDQYIAVLEDANATAKQVTEAERNKNLAVGAQLTGLTAAGIAQGLKGGKEPGDIVADALSEMINNQLAEALFNDLEPVLELAGKAFIESGRDISAAIAIVEDSGLILPSIAAQQQELMGNMMDEAVAGVVQAYTVFQDALYEQESRFEEAKNAYVSALQDELSEKQNLIRETESANDSLQRLTDSIQKYHMGILTGSGSVLGLGQRQNLAQSDFMRIAGMARSGDTDAMENITGAASTLLSTTRAAGRDYAEVFRLVQKELNAIAGMTEDEQSDSRQQIELLEKQIRQQEDLIAQITGIEEKTITELKETYLLEKTSLELMQEQDKLFQEMFKTELSQYDEILNLVENSITQIGAIRAVEEAIKNLKLASSGGGGGGGGGYIQPMDEVQKLYASIGRTGFGEDVSQIDPAGYAYWKSSGHEGAELEKAFYDAVRRHVEAHPNDAYTQYLRENASVKFAEGGTISGPTSGYTMPDATFHGVEHIINDNQMSEVAGLLREVKEVLLSIRDTDGNINKLTIKTHRILDRVTQGGTEIRTTEIA